MTGAVLYMEMKGITRCKLTISESAICKKFLGQIVSYFDPTWPVYRSLIVYLATLFLNVFVFVYIIDLKEYFFHCYGLY
jgi:hypothetical protein